MNQNTKEKCGTSQEDVKGQMSIDDYMGTTADDSADAGDESGLYATDSADMISQEGADASEEFQESDKETKGGSLSEVGKTRIPSDLCFFVESFAEELHYTLYEVSESTIRDEKDGEALLEAFAELTEAVLKKTRSVAEVLGRKEFLEEMRERIEEILKQ